MLCMPIVVGVVIVINIVHLETELVKANTTFGVRFGYMFIWLQEEIRTPFIKYLLGGGINLGKVHAQ